MADLKNSTNPKAADFVHDAAVEEASAVLQRLGASLSGLSEEEASARLEKYGPNEVAQEKKHDWLWRLWVAVRNPLVILLMILAILTFATAESSSDDIGGVVMLAMVILGGMGNTLGVAAGAFSGQISALNRRRSTKK